MVKNEQVTDKVLQEILKGVKSLNNNKLDKNLEVFIRNLYGSLSAEDSEKYEIDELAFSALETFKTISVRKKGKSLVRIYNLEQKDSQWSNQYTVIDIVNDDMPFLVDSVTEEINSKGYVISQLLHPVLMVARDDAGKIESIENKNGEGSKNMESIMRLHIPYIWNKKDIDQLHKDIVYVLGAVSNCVSDWKDILNKVSHIPMELSAATSLLSVDLNAKESGRLRSHVSEITEFIEWLKANNFIFLGYVNYNFKSKNPAMTRGSELGIFKLKDSKLEPEMPKPVFDKKNLSLLKITKANKKSMVHRNVHMDYIIIPMFDDNANIIGEHRILGLFTSIVYYQSAKNIPIVRNKIAWVQKKSKFPEGGHSGKALAAILEDFPRGELFQTSKEELFETAMGTVDLAINFRVRLFVREDEFGRFVSCLIYIPRDRMSTNLRINIEKILMEDFDGTISNHYTQITESHLARLQVIVKTNPGKIPAYDVKKIEDKIAQITRLWSEDLYEELLGRLGEREAGNIYNIYENAFSVSYKSRFSAEDAYYDIKQLNKVMATNDIAFDFYEPTNGEDDIFEFKVYSPQSQVTLSMIMPMLENMGLKTLDEHTYVCNPEKYKEIWIHRFRFLVTGGGRYKLRDIKSKFEIAIDKIWRGETQSDGLNKLILYASLNWRDVVLLRAYTKYFKQIGFHYGQGYIEEALASHPNLVSKIIALFYARFDPSLKKDRKNNAEQIKKDIEKILSRVSNLAEDKVIRGFIDLIMATVRTNYFQEDEAGNIKSYISLKFSPKNIQYIPKPRPYAEIFVYSPRMEGVHLRGGKVARGGLRWSDRREDFRTEILGLVKAQMTKNSVIIPVGSKGGFILKKPPVEGGREAFIQEGIECYKTFLRGLLDITDNIVSGNVVPPKNVVRHDDDDPYLVVAADKGTATFSDIANSVANEYGFWLGDAFASGGSAGYDHKKMGITAKGAWISVQRHFREMGVDVQKQDFTVVGIGDMAGDVFGNGMLLSKHIRLVAAFNHMHIFLDPNPDSAVSYKERKRLFKLPRSSWMNYNPKLISKGGGIFERSAKNIKLSKEAQEALGVSKSNLTPDELIKTILLSPVDLLWNGGIGTYIKAASESNDDAGDKTNDAVRVNGNQLRVKVIGEGGNLGCTQLGRIEYAKVGGRLNTDAIDNSAGVDCSDHEVNIKIALGEAMESGRLTLQDRNILLEKMTDTVSDLVLRDNILQTQAITIAQLRNHSMLEEQSRFMKFLEKKGLLDREVEFLPNNDDIAMREGSGNGLTRPELSVLLAYSKLSVYEEVLNSDLPNDPYYINDLMMYFPKEMHTKFAKQIDSHALRKEIIATSITNSIINRLGTSLYYRLLEETSAPTADIARAYTIIRDVYQLRDIWEDIESLDGKIEVKNQVELFIVVRKLIERGALWFLRRRNNKFKIYKEVENFLPGIGTLSKKLSSILPLSLKQDLNYNIDKFIKNGVPKPIAEKIAGMGMMASACDIVQVGQRTKLDVFIVGKIYFELEDQLSLGWMRKALGKLPTASYWQRLSINSLLDDLYEQQQRLTYEVAKSIGSNGVSAANAFAFWKEKNDSQISRYMHYLIELKSYEEPDFAMISVGAHKVRDICSC
ncbi:NAD-glutamate dehydrogenase [Rickettsiales bacterium]|nr:NAD-glutamate dehydrogenase [Rickettsiales bacterium]